MDRVVRPTLFFVPCIYTHDNTEMIAPDKPASSVLTDTLTVTPDFAENTILTSAATRPPVTDLP